MIAEAGLAALWIAAALSLLQLCLGALGLRFGTLNQPARPEPVEEQGFDKLSPNGGGGR